MDGIATDIGALGVRLDKVDANITALVAKDSRLDAKITAIDETLVKFNESLVNVTLFLADGINGVSDSVNDTIHIIGKALDKVEDEFNNVTARIDAIEERLLHFSSAKAFEGPSDSNPSGPASVISMANKDQLIVGLVVLNIGTILGCIACLLMSKRGGAKVKGYVYGDVVAADSDVEQLQK